MPKFYLTTAIDYVNGKPHLGHAYEKIAADVIARFKRLAGYETFFLTGTDEHSLNVARKAQSEGKSPKEFCDEMVAAFKLAWDKLDVKYDRFIRTTDEDHVATVQELVRRVNERGYIYQGTYSGWYCVSCEAFLNEGDLVDGKCPVHPSRSAEWVEEKNYFFSLSKLQERIRRHIEENLEFIQPETRRNEVLNRVKEGLQDVSISRSTLEWGIPLPMDPKQVVYVWFDALINYVTGAGYMDPEKGTFEKWWPADLHIIGKDITWFHCVIWPAILMAAGLSLPRAVFGHGFVNVRGARMSKSEGTVVDPIALAEEFGSDAVRYYLMRDVPFGRDGDFSVEGLTDCHDSDLANDLGNLLSRTTAMIDKYCDGRIPAPGEAGAQDEELVGLLRSVPEAFENAMERYDFTAALAEIWKVVDAGNKYIENTTPWILAREGNSGRLGSVMFNLAEALRVVAILISPFMPRASRGIWMQLGLSDFPENAGLAGAKKAGLIPVGTRINRGAPLFPRIDMKSKEEERQMSEPESATTSETLKASETGPGNLSVEAESDLISIEDFARIQLRVARVLTAERVEGADKLLRLEVDLGDEVRQIVAGIAKHYSPNELIGKQIVVVANLKPAKLRGLLSCGMLLAGVAPDGNSLAVITTDRKIPVGSRVR